MQDRLLQDFAPPDGETVGLLVRSGGAARVRADLEPQGLRRPTTCPRTLDPDEGALVVTNYHQLLRTREDAPTLRPHDGEERQIELLFDDGEPDEARGRRSRR